MRLNAHCLPPPYVPRVLLFWALAAAPALAYQAEPAPAPLQVLKVDRYEDDEARGSLRWAITTANQAPGRYRIEIAGVGSGPFVIRPASPLPAIKGPVEIVGIPWAVDGRFVAIDGSAYVGGSGTQACPGAEPGQSGANVRSTTLPGLVLRDTHGVVLSGLEIRHFCIGVLIHRASGNEIRDSRIVANRGGAGVLLTGDDGGGQSTATSTVHNRIVRNVFLDNGDGLELTRGAAWNLIADNLFRGGADNPEPSQGIEILWGNDNIVVRNRFEQYSDGLQINWGNRNYIAANRFTGNSNGLSISGRDNGVDGNTIAGNGIGIAVRPQPTSEANRFSANLLHGNGLPIERCHAGGACAPGQLRGAIVFGVPGLEHAAFAGSRGIGVDTDPSRRARICTGRQDRECQPPPNHGLAAPRLLAIDGEPGRRALRGRFDGRPGTQYRVEIFGNRQRGDDEAEVYLGRVDVQAGADGRAHFAYRLARHADGLASYTATVTDPEGATSPLSAALSPR